MENKNYISNYQRDYIWLSFKYNNRKLSSSYIHFACDTRMKNAHQHKTTIYYVFHRNEQYKIQFLGEQLFWLF